MKGRKWGKLPSGASCFRTSSDCFARVRARVQKLRVYRYASRKRYPTFLDYFRASSSPFDSHGSPLLDYKLQLPLLLLLLLLQRLLHHNARERARRYRMKLKRVSYHMHSREMGMGQEGDEKMKKRAN